MLILNYSSGWVRASKVVEEGVAMVEVVYRDQSKAVEEDRADVHKAAVVDLAVGKAVEEEHRNQDAEEEVVVDHVDSVAAVAAQKGLVAVVVVDDDDDVYGRPFCETWRVQRLGDILMCVVKKFKKVSVFGMYTPFFVCLASGKLDSEKFGHCLSQDVHFHNAFTEAYERAAECADDEEDKIELRKLKESVQDDLKIPDVVSLKCCHVLPKWSPPDNATCKYTDFLLATASGKVGENSHGKIATPFEKTKVAAYTLGAMVPWKRFRSFISNEIQAVLDPEDSSHNYKIWIDIYSSQEFEASTQLAEDMLDKLSVSLTREELNVIEKLYNRAMKLVVDFFCAQPIAQQTMVPLSQVYDPAEHRLTIFSDFDLGCSATDTSAILAQIAIVTIPKADSNGSETQLARMSSDELRSIWAALSVEYADEYEQGIESIMPSARVEFKYEVICNALEQFSDFEKRANSRVVQSGVLKGLNLGDIERAGQCFNLQDGCKGFFQEIAQTENQTTDIHILSYCWCGDFIRSAFSSAGLNVPNIHSNELVYEESICTGEIVRKLESPMEKLQAFNVILGGSNKDSKHLTIYIGGSVGDLLCLLNADIGIVIGSSPSLRKLGEQYGISFEPLFPGVVKKQKELAEGGFCPWNRLSGNLYTVSCWAEIHAFILGS